VNELVHAGALVSARLHGLVHTIASASMRTRAF
jgi:hypothetical protein